MIAPSQEIVEKPNLNDLPIIQCWPQDGGRFITLPQVFTHDPRNGKRNVGMYRMQVFDAKTTGMHWQIQKGGGFHYYQADKINKPLELAVALGTDPAMLLATIAPLPEGIDEAMFAGFLRKKSTQLVGGRSISISVPANAEFILEGIRTAQRAQERRTLRRSLRTLFCRGRIPGLPYYCRHAEKRPDLSRGSCRHSSNGR